MVSRCWITVLVMLDGSLSALVSGAVLRVLVVPGLMLCVSSVLISCLKFWCMVRRSGDVLLGLVLKGLVLCLT